MKHLNTELSLRQVKIAIVTILSLFLYSIANSILVYKAYAQLSEEGVSELIDIIYNWQKRAISNIIISESCPPNYEPAFLSVLWPGVNEGCWCGNVPDATIKSEKIMCNPFCKNSCTVRQSVLGCSNVIAHNPQSLSFVAEKSGTNVQICINRSMEKWSDVAINSVGACPEGYNTCGLSQDNIFCTQEAACPINDVKITSISVADIPLCVAPDCMILTQNTSIAKKLEIKRGNTYDALPISEFRLNEFSMCSVMTQDNITPGRSQFYLLNRKINACYHFGEFRWKLIDQIQESTLFQMNSLSTYISSLSSISDPGRGLQGYYPLGSNGDDFTWKLFSRRYIPFNRSCRNRMKDLINSRDYIETVRSAQLGLMIMSFLSVFGLGIILTFLEIQDLRGIDLPCFPGEGREKRKKMVIVKKLLNYSLKFMQIPFQIWAIVTVGKFSSLFSSIVGEKCSDLQTHQTLSFLVNNLKPTLNFDIIAIVILVVSIIVDIVLVIYHNRKDKKLKALYQDQESALADNSQIELRNAPDTMSISQMNEKSMIEDQISQSLKESSAEISITENNTVEHVQQDIIRSISNKNQMQTALEEFSEEYLAQKDPQSPNLEQKQSLHRPLDNTYQDEV